MDGNVFYVGKGTGNRLLKHITIAKGNSVSKNRNPKLYNKIGKIIMSGGTVIPFKVSEFEIEQYALQAEKELIAAIGLYDLTNLTDGGGGTSYSSGFTKEHRDNISKAKKGKVYPYMFQKRSPETGRKISEALKGRKFPAGQTCYWKGRHLPEDVRLKMSLSHKGKKFTLEHRMALSISHKGKKFTLEHREALSRSNKGKPHRK